jgi:large subunit ribosomal protein L3
MNFILGKKIEMSQLFDNKGNVVPVTVVQAGPCLVTQVKNEEKDKYVAVQIGFGKKKNLSKALKNHLKDLDSYRWLREFRLEDSKELKRGDKIEVTTFEEGEKVKITGTSKGKGFQGVVKRHGFHGQHKTHGNKDQERMPGSAGPTDPARVFKGKKMPGHMGDDRVTVKNLEVVKIDEENNLLYIKGAVPGARSGLIMILGNGELKVNVVKEKPVEKKEEITEEAPKTEDKVEVKKEDKPEKEEKVEETKKVEVKVEEKKEEKSESKSEQKEDK